MEKINKIEKVPYASKGWVENFLDLVKRVKFSKVNKDIIRQYDLTSPGNESKLSNTLRFLKIIENEEGKVDEEKIKNLRMEGEIFKSTLKSILKDSYKEVFETIDVKKAAISDLNNFFIGRYDYSQNQAMAASMLFIFLCEKAGINLSEKITKLSFRSTHSKRSDNKRIRKVNKKTTKDKFVEEDNIGKGEYVVTIKGKDVSLNKKVKNVGDLNSLIKTMEVICNFEDDTH